VKEISVAVNSFTGLPRGFAFVMYENSDDAERAKEKLNETDFKGSKIRVNFGNPSNVSQLARVKKLEPNAGNGIHTETRNPNLPSFDIKGNPILPRGRGRGFRGTIRGRVGLGRVIANPNVRGGKGFRGVPIKPAPVQLVMPTHINMMQPDYAQYYYSQYANATGYTPSMAVTPVTPVSSVYPYAYTTNYSNFTVPNPYTPMTYNYASTSNAYQWSQEAAAYYYNQYDQKNTPQLNTETSNTATLALAGLKRPTESFSNFPLQNSSYSVDKKRQKKKSVITKDDVRTSIIYLNILKELLICEELLILINHLEIQLITDYLQYWYEIFWLN